MITEFPKDKSVAVECYNDEQVVALLQYAKASGVATSLTVNRGPHEDGPPTAVIYNASKWAYAIWKTPGPADSLEPSWVTPTEWKLCCDNYELPVRKPKSGEVWNGNGIPHLVDFDDCNNRVRGMALGGSYPFDLTIDAFLESFTFVRDSVLPETPTCSKVWCSPSGVPMRVGSVEMYLVGHKTWELTVTLKFVGSTEDGIIQKVEAEAFNLQSK